MRAMAAGFVVALALDAPVHAQTGAQTPSAFTNRLAGAYEPCFTAQNADPKPPPEQRIAVCQQAIDSLTLLGRLLPSMGTPHDKNLHAMDLSLSYLTLAGAYIGVDKVRSSRACTASEASWTAMSAVIDANSPQNYRATFKSVRESLVTVITRCRSEKGTPAGAVPLPPA